MIKISKIYIKNFICDNSNKNNIKFVLTKKHEYKVFYKDLYEILETKDNFYLMLSQNQGVIIIKENCNKKLIEFIEGLKG